MNKDKKRRLQDRKIFLLSFFNLFPANTYAEIEVNGFWLIRYQNGNNKNWNVALYSKESYRQYKQGGGLFKEHTNSLTTY